MLTHEELSALWEKDAHIDKHQLDMEAIRIPLLHQKYLDHYLQVRARRIALESRLEVLQRDKSAYYAGQATSDKYKDKPFDLKVRTKAEIMRYVEADEDVQAITQKIQYCDLLIEGLNFILESIKWRNQSIKNAISWAQFTAGV